MWGAPATRLNLKRQLLNKDSLSLFTSGGETRLLEMKVDLDGLQIEVRLFFSNGFFFFFFFSSSKKPLTSLLSSLASQVGDLLLIDTEDKEEEESLEDLE